MYKDKKIVWIFLFPTLMLITLFLYAPFIASIINSLFSIEDIAGINKSFIGIGNYKELIGDAVVHTALKNTFIMMVFTVVFEAGLGMLLALFVDGIRRGQKIYRTIFFFPVVISATAIGLMFALLYNYDMGMLNQILAKLGKEPVYWLQENWALTMVAVPIVWQYVGFYFVIVLTGISSIPDDIYESAYLDGITGFKKTIYITIPLIKGVIKSCLILVITGTLKIFDLPWVILPRGGPNETTYLLGTYQYKTVYEAGRVGYGCTLAVIIVLLGLGIAFIVNKTLRAEEL